MLQKIINLGIYLIVFSLPLYLVRFQIGWLSLNVLEVMICGLFGIWLFSKAKHKVSTYQYPIFLIFLGITLATWFSVDLQTSAGIWKSWFIVPLFFFFVVINSIKTKEQIRNILTALFLSGLGVGLIALFYWLSNQLTYDGRLRAFYLSPNHLAMYLSPILVLSLYLYFWTKNNLSKILLAIGYSLLIFIIYLTFSYGAWLGIIAALVFISFFSSKKALFKVIIISFLLLLIVLMPGFLEKKIASFESRMMIWQSALEIIKDHPLIGIGPGMFQKYYLDYQVRFEFYLEWAVPQPHNLFLAFWLQTGLLGLIGFVWLLILFFRSRTSKLFIAAMVYIIIHGLIDTTYWKNDLAIIFWLIIALSCITSYLFYSQTKDNLPKEAGAIAGHHKSQWL